MVQYTVSTTISPRQDASIYAIKVTTNDDSSGFIVGPDGEAMFFAGKSEARAKLVEMKRKTGGTVRRTFDCLRFGQGVKHR